MTDRIDRIGLVGSNVAWNYMEATFKKTVEPDFFLFCSASIGELQKPCFKWRVCVFRGDRGVREGGNISGPATDEAS